MDRSGSRSESVIGAAVLAVLCLAAAILDAPRVRRATPFRVGFLFPEVVWSEQHEMAVQLWEAVTRRIGRPEGRPVEIVDVGWRMATGREYRFDRRLVARDCRSVDLLVCFGSPEAVVSDLASLPPVFVLAVLDARGEDFAERLRREGHPVTAWISTIPVVTYVRLVMGLFPEIRRIGLLCAEDDDDAVRTAAKLVMAFGERGVAVRVATAPPGASQAPAAGDLAADCEAIFLLTAPHLTGDTQAVLALRRAERRPLFGRGFSLLPRSLYLASIRAAGCIEVPERILAIADGARVTDFSFLREEADRVALDLDVARELGREFPDEALRAAGVTLLDREAGEERFPGR